MLYIKKADYEKILTHCMEELPMEACGLLGGVKEGNVQYVKRVYPQSNMDRDASHFFMNPAEQFAAVRDMRACGLELLGNFHSHPKSSAKLSEEDMRFAGDSSLVYLVLSLADRQNPVLKAFHVEPSKHVTEEPIIIEGDEQV